MFSGYDINPDNRGPEADYPFKPNDFQKSNSGYQDHRHVYNLKAPIFEAGGNDNFQIPHHIRMLFGDTENKPLFDAKNNANNFNANSQTSLPSRSTVDSRRQSHGPSDPHDGLRYVSFNTLLNQSNDFALGKGNSNDLNTSGLSNPDVKNVSLNNLSRDSGLRGDMNTSQNRRNLSSRASMKSKKNYQVTINDDIQLIERIESFLNQITSNHNKICPFCTKFIDIKKSNFQNVSAFFSTTTKRYYITHFDCYLKSNSNHAPAKVVSLTGVPKATVNSQLSALPALDSTNFLRSDRRAYFVNIEGYHPISSHLLFKIEKICYALEHNHSKNQLLYLNLANKGSSIFEPTSYTIPFNEFRLVVNVHLTHSNEDPFSYEFIADFSQVKVTTDQKPSYAEAYFPPESNHIALGTQIVYDANSELDKQLNYKINLDSSFQNTSITASGRPEFGRNVFLILKQFSINLPLKRIEKQNQESSMSNLLPEALFNSLDSSLVNSQKKPHSKLHLNPNAPLFSHVAGQADQNPQSLLMQGSHPNMSNINSFGQNMGSFNNQPNFNNMAPTNNTNNNNINPYFNNSLFSQGFQVDQLGQFNMPSSQYQDFNSQQQQNEGPMLPPGLSSGMSQNDNASYAPPTQFMSRSQNAAPARNRGLHVDTRFQVNHVIVEASEEHQSSAANTPNHIPGENGAPSFERAKSKGPNNLYTAVLSGRKNDNSLTNSPCPSVTKIHNRYFGEVATPKSDLPESPISPSGDNNFEYQGTEDFGSGPFGEDTIENFKLDDHLGHLCEFAKTYNGSRILQKFFPRANQDEVELVIDEIEENIDELMLDPYANYMFQTLAQSCSADQRYRLLQEIAPSMVRVACDRKGTHSLQAIVSLVNRDVEEKLIRDALQGHIVELAFDSQGTHLIQKLIVAISLQNIGFIYQPLVERFLDVVNHSFGLCVMKQLMTKVEKSPELKKRIVDLLCDNLENLIQNPYGNYALQHAMEFWPNDCRNILEKVSDKIVQYSNQKFSSNVIEKSVVIAPQDIRKKYLMQIIRSERLAELMKNKYGNYVLLKMLSTLDVDGKQLMIQNLTKNLNLVNVAKYRSRWAQFIEENPLKIPSANTAQTTKPSQFKNASQSGDYSGNSAKEPTEINSPGSAELWKDTLKKKNSRNQEEKSQFFYESSKGTSGRSGTYGEDVESYQSPDVTKNPKRLNDNQNVGSGQKKGKNANQKFYSEKGQHHMAKGGHNTFY